jgi:hypothetical protein
VARNAALLDLSRWRHCCCVIDGMSEFWCMPMCTTRMASATRQSSTKS